MDQSIQIQRQITGKMIRQSFVDDETEQVGAQAKACANNGVDKDT